MSAQPYVFAIHDGDIGRHGGPHAAIAQRLTDGGFDVGLMLWTASPSIYSQGQIAEFWRKAFDQAGIERMDQWHDNEKERTWYRVWRRGS